MSKVILVLGLIICGLGIYNLVTDVGFDAWVTATTFCEKSFKRVDIDAYKLGMLSMSLGAGRMNKEDSLDYSAGVVVNKNINDYVNIGDTIYTIYSNKKLENIDINCYEISDKKEENINLIYEIVE